MNCRKSLFITETVHAEAGHAAPEPVTRVAAIAVLDNPAAGRFMADLSDLADIGLAFGEAFAAAAVDMLRRAPVAYGKAAIVGVHGEVEHAAGILHPKLGKPMRAACGGGEALIPSVAKVSSAGAAIDVPLAHKDEIWSFNELDTMTVMVADAPRPDEILAVMVFSDGGRPSPRIGSGRAVV